MNRRNPIQQAIGKRCIFTKTSQPELSQKMMNLDDDEDDKLLLCIALVLYFHPGEERR